MSESSSERDPVEELAEQFLARCRCGDRPALSEYTDRYPQWAEKIRRLFPLLVDMEAARPAAQDGPSTAGVLVGAGQKLERLGDYQILGEVGRGGMGIVYEAVQVSLGRHVALKVLPQHARLDPRHLQRFEREAKAAARLHHTNIVPVYGIGEENGLHYYVMQFIQGLSLDEVLAELRRLRRPKQPPTAHEKTRDIPAKAAKELSAASVVQSLPSGKLSGGPASGGCQPPDAAKDQGADAAAAAHSSASVTAIHLPGQSADSTLSDTGRAYWQSVAHVGVQVAEALAYAGSQGILHRDIKPSNLLLDTQGTVWVTDFGLAKAAGSQDLTHTGDVVGTLRYMAPERLQGKSDPRGDIYSLGITLYELLTLRPAFVDSDRARLMQRVTHEEPPRPRKLDRLIPRDLETIVLKAMDKEPALRYSTAADLAEDLRRFLTDRPVRARPVGPLERLWRWSRRNPLVASSLAAVAAILVLGTVVGWLLAVWAFTEKGRADHKAAEADAERIAALTAENDTRQHLYAAKISLMQQSWDTNQVSHLRALLTETADYPDRGFEWYYWQGQCHRDLLTLIGHGAQVWAVAWSPDGKFLASGSANGTVKGWQAANGQEILALKGGMSIVTSLCWSPDGKRLATANMDGITKVWDVADGRERFALKARTAGFRSVSWSPAGKRLATAADDGKVRIWDAEDGRELLTLEAHQGVVASVSWSPDGKRLATGAEREEVAKVWDAADGRELFALKGHMPGIFSVAWSPDGKRLAAGYLDGMAKVWDTADRRELFSLKGHAGRIRSVCWSPDGKRLATGSFDAMAKVWDMANGVELFPFKGHTDMIHSVSWSPDGKWLATGSADGTAKVWDAAGDRGLVTFKGHTDEVDSVSWSPNGKRLATGSGSGTVKVWDAANGRELFSLKGHTDRVDSVCWSRDGNRLATGSFDGTAKVWDVTTQREMLTIQGRRVCWSPDEARLATVCEDGTAKIWETRDGRQLHNLDGHRSVVTAVSWSPDEKRLATAGADGTIIVWDAMHGRELASLPGHTSAISVVAWSPDGQQLASACAGYGWDGLSDVGEVKIWNAAHGREILTLNHTGKVTSVSWSPDGKRLAIGSYYGTVKVWDASSGRELLGYTGVITSVSWSPDGKRLALGCWDGTVRLQEATNSEAVQEWARQDRALEDGLTRKALRNPHAQGFIRRWLLLLPLPLADGETGAQAMDRRQLPDEAQLRPRMGERVPVKGRELVWREHCSPEAIVDFNALLGRTTDRGVAYAVCYVHSDRARDDLWLQVGSDDQAKVYLNGQVVYQSRPTRPLNGLDPPRGPLRLKQGTNLLVFKVVNEGAGWEGCTRLVDTAGRPAQGIRVKLSPE